MYRLRNSPEELQQPRLPVPSARGQFRHPTVAYRTRRLQYAVLRRISLHNIIQAFFTRGPLRATERELA